MTFLRWLASWFRSAYGDEPRKCPWGYADCEWCNPEPEDP